MGEHHYDVGDRVTVGTDKQGSYDGVIVGFGTGLGNDFVMDGTRHVMVVMPDSPVLIRYFGGNGTAQVGAAHWDASVRPRG